MVLGKLWVDKEHNVVYFTPLRKKKGDSWWLGSLEGLKKYLGNEIVELLETQGHAFVDLTLL